MLNEEQAEDLVELMLQDGMKGLLKELDRCAELLERDVLSYSLDAGPERLMILKARSEGGRKVVTLFKACLEKLRRDALGTKS